MRTTEKKTRTHAHPYRARLVALYSPAAAAKLSKAVAQLSVARSVGHLSRAAVARRFGFPGSPKAEKHGETTSLHGSP